MLCFHVSSKRSSPGTDSLRFGKALVQALNDMKALFDTESADKEQRKQK
jgi:hypothetical protein